MEILKGENIRVFIHYKSKPLETRGKMDKYEESYLLYQKGLEYFKMGDFQSSLDCFLKSNELDEHSRTFARIYECLIKLGRDAEAKPNIEIAYMKNPNHDKVTIQYVETLIHEGKFKEAKEILEKSLKRNGSYNPAKKLLERLKNELN
jgi:tetratricopeptide (TPR) repeat protein